MRIVVAGGKLQGVEATYLARQAGWDVTLIDNNPVAPAVGLCDEFYQLNILDAGKKLTDIIKKSDLIIPAIEDGTVLDTLVKVANMSGVPLAYDQNAYAISSSKRRSDRLFAQNRIPAPAYWPKCALPIIAKPSDSSGSQGVSLIENNTELFEFLQQNSGDLDNWVMQEYLNGPSYSLEVVGCNGRYVALQTTELEMDEDYDCKRVLAPTVLDKTLENKFRNIAVEIARTINLNGIMDVEVIKQGNRLKVLEIDARLPSQTPTAVYKSSGVNMLSLISDVFTRGVLKSPSVQGLKRAVIYEHISVAGSRLVNLGEHIMSDAGPLKLCQDFFGADEAITNYEAASDSWVATLIITESSLSEARSKREEVIANICRGCLIENVI